MSRHHLLVKSLPKFSVCRTLILASFVWLTFLMAFYFMWDPELIEKIEKRKLQDKKIEAFVESPVAKSHEAKSFQVFKSGERTARKLNKEFSDYEKIVTPVPSEVLQKLKLINPGENGKAVRLRNYSEAIKQKIKIGWKNHEFNEFISDLISINRSLPDPRDEYCKQINIYRNILPQTSVIIIFHNEAWSTLLRSVHSVLNRSPEHLIAEIILVDDYSNMLHLKKPLEDYMSQFPKVKILRAEKREGLIKARIRGAVAASGPTLTFLDSHIECAEGWLEPLLDRIAENPTNVVCPVIDLIDDKTFEFSYQTAKMLQVGGFDWQLVFDWNVVPPEESKRKNNSAEPTRSPTMAGGLFSIDKEFFVRLGMYDPQFDIWGAENLELSFKTWMCGGTLEIIPCSHVGHIFRTNSPYKWRPGVDVLRKNTIRLVEVWLDEYAIIYYHRTGFDKGEFGDISDRLKLRKDLQCKSFKWYMENVYSWKKVPDNLAEGQVHNEALGNLICLDSEASEHEASGTLKTYSCHGSGGNQFFEYTKDLELKNDLHCLDFNKDLLMFKCHEGKGPQEWLYNLETFQLLHNVTRNCLDMEVETGTPVIRTCSSSPSQKWTFEFLYKDKFMALT